MFELAIGSSIGVALVGSLWYGILIDKIISNLKDALTTTDGVGTLTNTWLTRYLLSNVSVVVHKTGLLYDVSIRTVIWGTIMFQRDGSFDDAVESGQRLITRVEDILTALKETEHIMWERRVFGEPTVSIPLTHAKEEDQ